MTADGTLPDDAVLSPSEPVPVHPATAMLQAWEKRPRSKDKKERIADDFYPTPSWVVDAIKPHLPHARTVLDPAAGTGELLNAMIAEYGIAIELDEARGQKCLRGFCDELHTGDALAMSWPAADLLLSNPPFLLARQFIERAIQWRAQDPRRTVAILARLTILESAERRELHQQHPADVYVLSTRPKFRGDTNGTDSVTACWLVFGPGRGGRWSVL